MNCNVKLASGIINVTLDEVNIFSQAVNNEYLLLDESLYIVEMKESPIPSVAIYIISC